MEDLDKVRQALIDLNKDADYHLLGTCSEDPTERVQSYDRYLETRKQIDDIHTKLQDWIQKWGN